MIIDQDYCLRLLNLADDAQPLFNILDSQRAKMRVWLPFVDYSLKAEDTREGLQAIDTEANPHFCILFRNEVVGLIGFKDTDTTNKRTEIGYWLSSDHQSKGVMTRAVQQLLHYAFNDMQMNRVTIKAAVLNDKSRNIPQRLGFCQEGVERDGELLVDNLYTDIVVYSLLKKEYEELKQKWK